MEVVIFGADGQLGQAFKVFFPKSICYTHKQVDITHTSRVEKILSHLQSPLVINAAAYTDVEMAEMESVLAYKVNALGPAVVAKATRESGGTLIQISTDYVFDGEKGNYSEEDTPHPINVYGLSKLAGEYAVRAFCSKHYIIRTSGLFGPNPSFGDNNFVSKRVEQIKKGEEIKMVADQWTVPTYTEDLANAIDKLLQRKVAYGDYHIVNSGGEISWFDFTKEIAGTGNFKVNINSISTEESHTRIRRPKLSTLNAERINSLGIQMPDWRISMQKYLENLNNQL